MASSQPLSPWQQYNSFQTYPMIYHTIHLITAVSLPTAGISGQICMTQRARVGWWLYNIGRTLSRELEFTGTGGLIISYLPHQRDDGK